MERVIFHVDVNSAFLSWEAVKRLKAGDPVDLRTIPAAVGGDEKLRKGIILAKSIPAKRMGVQTGEPIGLARRKCPELTVVLPDYPLFIEMSNAFVSILEDYSPVIEQFSIDECFLDYTGLEHLFGPPRQAADTIRDRIRRELGFTVNVGVGPNKVLAKMAGELEKPDKTHTLFPAELPGKLWPLPVGELFMAGPKSQEKLRMLSLRTIGDLARADPRMLARQLGQQGLTLWRYANGIDPSPVTPGGQTPAKSYSQSVTLPEDLTRKEDLLVILSQLCWALAHRMRHGGAACRTVSLYLRDHDFRGSRRDRTLGSPTDSSGLLFRTVQQLLGELWRGQPLRALGIGFSNLQESGVYPYSLLDSRRSLREGALDRLADRLQQKYGAPQLQPARCLERQAIAHLDRYSPEGGKPRTRCPF